MRISFVIYDGMTTLDFLGVLDAVTRLKTMGFQKDLEWRVCARTAEVTDGTGLVLKAQEVARPLTGYDMVVVPGGFATERLEMDTAFAEWLKTAKDARWKVSVCTGSVLLGVAGFLTGKVATTHPMAFERLSKYCKRVSEERIVDEGDVITARGVTSSIDLGLYLVGKLAGSEVRDKIRKQMDYYPALELLSRPAETRLDIE